VVEPLMFVKEMLSTLCLVLGMCSETVLWCCGEKYRPPSRVLNKRCLFLD